MLNGHGVPVPRGGAWQGANALACRAAKWALQIAGAIGGTPGSPMPPGDALLSAMWTCVSGVVSIRATK